VGAPPWRGSPWLVLCTPRWEATQWNGPVLAIGDTPARNLGPDLLAPETVAHDVVARLRRTDQSRLVGEALVDQRLVAGIGNMWLSELLWHARVSPWAPLRDVSDDTVTAALGWAREAMTASVGGRRPARAVYRRAGRGCPRCGDVITARGLGDANRTAYWCPTCQPQE